MHPAEIEACLDSMVVLVDTREQPSDRAKKRYETFGVPWKRQKLDYGDYSAEFTISNAPIMVNAVIERKMNLDELATCFTRDRKRFKAEFERAVLDNASVYLMVEDASWENLINGRYRSKFNPTAFLASITAWMVRYNLKVIFCKHETSGRLIKEILYREMKQELESGRYG